MADQVMPHVLKMVTAWLQATPTVNNVVSKEISYRLTGTYPAIRLTDVGPIHRGPEEHLRRVQVECWAPTYTVAEDLAAAVEAALPDIRGSWAGGYCAGGSVESGPFANPDPTSEKFRHQLDLALWIYPLA